MSCKLECKDPLTCPHITVDKLEAMFEQLSQWRPPQPDLEIVSPAEHKWRVAHPDSTHYDYVMRDRASST